MKQEKKIIFCETAKNKRLDLLYLLNQAEMRRTSHAERTNPASPEDARRKDFPEKRGRK